jgi:FkbM family methyltransferase
MSGLKLNEQEIRRWFRDNGDHTHNINYDLSENSIIMDLGGYKGLWAQQMIDKYNPHVYILEPVPVFYETMLTKFSNNKKVRLLDVGIGIDNIDGFINMNNDGTSTNLTNGESIKVKFNTIETILEYFKLGSVDLIQINIEGDEYSLLENMLITGTINRFRNIQVQFHYGIKNDIERRNYIRNELLNNGFSEKFNYPFVWESWSK